MSRLGILEPTSLLGQELRTRLEAEPDLWDELLLFTRRPERIGALTEVAGAAAMVQELHEDELEQLDLLLVCAPTAGEMDFLQRAPEGLVRLVVAPLAPVPGGQLLLADWNLDETDRDQILVSPHPAVVGLAYLLLPLEELQLEEAVATLLRPASMYEESALDEVFEQTRTLLSFQKPTPGEHYSHQIAFNLLRGPADEEVVLDQLGALLHPGPRLAVHTLQASVFHGFSVSLFCRLGAKATPEDVALHLSPQPHVELSETPEGMGPIDAVSRETVLLGEVRAAAGVPGGFWLWAVLDNLTRGGAANALAIARRVLGRDSGGS